MIWNRFGWQKQCLFMAVCESLYVASEQQQKKKMLFVNRMSVREPVIVLTLNRFHVMRYSSRMFSFFYSSMYFAYLYLCDCAFAFAFAFAFENRFFFFSSYFFSHIWMVYNKVNCVLKIHIQYIISILIIYSQKSTEKLFSCVLS